MFPKKGNFSLSGHARENGSTRYAVMIAQALRGELGISHGATKTSMRWTSASARTAKHWLAGHHGPGGGHLIALLRESEPVYEAVLTAPGRRDAVFAARMLMAHGAVAEVRALLRREISASAEARTSNLAQRADAAARESEGSKQPRKTEP